MASYIKTLKEDNGDITYPQTLGSAVLLTGGADLETELAGKASSSSVANKIDIGDVQSSDIASNAITTAKIADGAVTTAKIDSAAVTSAKIDWTTVMKPTNYASSVTHFLGAYNSNSQQVLLYPNGDVVINITILISSATSAKTAYDVLDLPLDFVMSSGYNVVLGAFSSSGFSAGGAYIRSSQRRIRAWTYNALSSGAELSIFGKFNINGMQ